MASKSLKIDKTLRPISLWGHPEGRVTGSIFVQPEVDNNRGEEPDDILNQDALLLVLQKQDTKKIRFYNRSAIVRAEYPKSGTKLSEDSHAYNRQLMMMDGVGITNPGITGKIQESLPSKCSRLYNCLNQIADRFIKLHSLDETQIRPEDG